MKYPSEAQYLWDTYVPDRGQADTVQGELIRAIEKLRWEAQTNGNINWDTGFEILADYLQDTLCTSSVFDDPAKDELQRDISRIKDFDYPVVEDDIYDRVTDRIVEWYQENKTPIPKAYNPELDR